MSLTIARVALLLAATAVTIESSHAQTAPQDDASIGTFTGTFNGQLSNLVWYQGTTSLSIANAYAGSVTLSGVGTFGGSFNSPIPLQSVTGPWLPTESVNSSWSQNSAYNFNLTNYYYFSRSQQAAARSTTSDLASRLAGKVYYIVTQRAGQSDKAECFACTGNETVLDAVSQIQGLPNACSGKMWIERPTPNKPEKKTVLSIDWEAISRRGINVTNYKIEPGDRLVLGEDPLVARANRIEKKFTQIARLAGTASLTTSTFGYPKSAPVNNEIVKGLVGQDFLTNDPVTKTFILEAIGLKEGQ